MFAAPVRTRRTTWHQRRARRLRAQPCLLPLYTPSCCDGCHGMPCLDPPPGLSFEVSLDSPATPWYQNPGMVVLPEQVPDWGFTYQNVPTMATQTQLAEEQAVMLAAEWDRKNEEFMADLDRRHEAIEKLATQLSDKGAVMFREASRHERDCAATLRADEECQVQLKPASGGTDKNPAPLSLPPEEESKMQHDEVERGSDERLCVACCRIFEMGETPIQLCCHAVCRHCLGKSVSMIGGYCSACGTRRQSENEGVMSVHCVEGDDEELIDMSQREKLADPYYHGMIKRAGFTGEVINIEGGKQTGVRLYRILYNDGDQEHLAEDEVAESIVEVGPAFALKWGAARR